MFMENMHFSLYKAGFTCYTSLCFLVVFRVLKNNIHSILKAFRLTKIIEKEIISIT
jgi:hypothetical protein